MCICTEVYICAYLKKTQHVANKFCITDMDNIHGQCGFHLMMLDLKASKQYYFLFPGTKAQTFRANCWVEPMNMFLYFYCFYL